MPCDVSGGKVGCQNHSTKRVQRVVASSLETATDAAERLSGTSLMRHAVRELDQSVTAHNSKREATLLRRTQADQQQALVRDQLKRLSEDARFAIAKGRDDLAAQTIARQIDCERELERLDGVAAEARNEAASLADGIAEISRRKTRLQAELRTIDSAQAKMDSSAANAKAERKVRQAEDTSTE